MRGSVSLASVVLGSAILAGCATANETYALGAVVVVGALVLSQRPDAGWDATASEEGRGRFHIEIRRVAWTGSGEGDFARRFDREAQRVAGERGCSAFRVLAYRERHEPALAGSSKVAEGTIECA
ncbi:MAG TPA: hypothetical protein VLV56_15640 [Burkholderiales bacterium]|nr:hypothetical protein [Burkholderiales bacterium]